MKNKIVLIATTLLMAVSAQAEQIQASQANDLPSRTVQAEHLLVNLISLTQKIAFGFRPDEAILDQKGQMCYDLGRIDMGSFALTATVIGNSSNVKLQELKKQVAATRSQADTLHEGLCRKNTFTVEMVRELSGLLVADLIRAERAFLK